MCKKTNCVECNELFVPEYMDYNICPTCANKTRVSLNVPTVEVRVCGWCGAQCTDEFCSGECETKCMAAYEKDMKQAHEFYGAHYDALDEAIDKDMAAMPEPTIPKVVCVKCSTTVDGSDTIDGECYTCAIPF